MSNNKQKKRTGDMGRNHFVFYFFYTLFTIFVRPLLKIKFKRKIKRLEKPAIVLCNHGSFTDFFYAGIILRKDNPRYITARLYFYNKFAEKVLRNVGCFPKSMFTSDIENAKTCVKIINNGDVLVMMPEARLSTAGKFEDIQDATLKFIRKMNVNVYTLKLGGDYFAYPKWANSLRIRSLVECDLDVLFKAGEPMTLSQEEFDEKVCSKLYYNDFEWLEKHPEVQYKSKDLAEGLENILNVCPKCNKRLTIQTNGRKVYCTNCDFSVKMDNRYKFNENPYFENFQQWYDYQVEITKNEIEKGDYKLESKVQLMHSAKKRNHQLRLAGEGICTLDESGLRYVGTDDGKQIDKFFPLDTIYRLLFGAGEDFEIYEGSEIYYFVPEDRRSCVMWYIASILLKDFHDSKKRVKDGK